MALKHTIKKADYDKLSDELKNEYVAGDADGEYVLDVEGLPVPEDVGPIKRALQKEKDEVKKLKGEKAELQTKVDAVPDVEALKTAHKEETGKLRKFVENSLVDAEAARIASKISNSPKLLEPHIKARLKADMSGEVPVTKVLGADGKVSELTIEQLSQEFVANADFKAIIIASKATGGGSVRSPLAPGGGGTPTGEKPDKATDLSSLPGKDLAARITERKAAAQAQQ